jgi:quercetin dioxygenase-like cupin family protein
MTLRYLVLTMTIAALAAAESPSKAIVINTGTADWKPEKLPGAESVLIREDPASGGMDLLVRYPSGHVIAPHFHDSNERIFVAEGQLTLQRESGDARLEVGGYAFLPAGEVQRLSCTSKSRCTFYLSWDGKPRSHPVK